MVDRRFFLIGTLVGLAACASPESSTNQGVAPPVPRDYNVKSLTVTVPNTLIVSEANLYYPSGDIVWREDPPGNRYEQVRKIYETGMRRGAQTLRGSRDVNVAIEVRRFHSLSEKARRSIGGVHSIRFVLTVFDSRSGQVIEGPRLVSADLKAFGGSEAQRAEAQGETQKKRVTDHLARVIQTELGG